MSQLALIATCALLLACSGAVLAATPNVLLIVVDDLRPELGAYGYNQSSPNIVDFAKTAALFKGAYCQYSICSPSRASFLTGLRPETTQVFDLQKYFRNTVGLQNTTTMPQFFKNMGYRVAGGGKIFHPGAASGGDDDGVSWTEPYYHSPNERMFSRNTQSWAARSDPVADFPDYQIASNTIAQLQALKGGKFFVAMGLHKPHLPFVFPRSYLDLYPVDVPLANDTNPPTNLPGQAWSNYGELKMYDDVKNLNLANGQGDWMPVSKAKELRRAYWAATSFADSQVGRVLAELETLGLAHNTTVVVMSDHGWHLGDMGEWSKMTTFEPANRVVLLIRDPSRPASANATVLTNVELIDVYPTLVDAAAFPVPAYLEGKSLTPLLDSPHARPAAWTGNAFSQVLRSMAAYRTNPQMGYTLRTADWRYTEWVRYNTTSGRADWDALEALELYDHRGDAKNVFGYYERANQATNPDYGNLRLSLSAMLRTQSAVQAVSPSSQSTSGAPVQTTSGGGVPRPAAAAALVSCLLAVLACLRIPLMS